MNTVPPPSSNAPANPVIVVGAGYAGLVAVYELSKRRQGTTCLETSLALLIVGLTIS